MATMLVEDRRKVGAEVVHGHDECFSRASLLLTNMGLPNGLLPLKEIEEVGFVKETGYFWVRQKQKSEHIFTQINTRVSYGQDVSGYLEMKKLKKLQGVKVKEFVLWVSLSEINNDEPRPGSTYFKAIGVLGKYHPTAAFLLDDNITKTKM